MTDNTARKLSQAQLCVACIHMPEYATYHIEIESCRQFVSDLGVVPKPMPKSEALPAAVRVKQCLCVFAHTKAQPIQYLPCYSNTICANRSEVALGWE